MGLNCCIKKRKHYSSHLLDSSAWNNVWTGLEGAAQGALEPPSLEVALGALGWGQGGDWHSLDSMVLGVFAHLSDSGTQ